MTKSELKAKAAELGKLFKVNPKEDNLTYQEEGTGVYQIKEKELASAILKAKRIKDFEKYGIDDAEWDLDDGYIVFMKGDNAIYFSAVVDMEMNESSNAELRKLAQEAAKKLGIKITETPDSFKPLMGAQFEITEKDYFKIVSAFKRAGSDPEELGFYDMTFDNHDLTVLIDFEDMDDGIQFYVPGINESGKSAMNEGTPSKDEGRKLAAKYAKFLGIAHKETDDTWGGDGAIFKISVKGFVNAVKKIRTTQGAKQLPVDKMKVFTTGAVVEKLDVDEVEIADNEGYIRFTKGTKDVYLQTDWAEDDKELLAESDEINESLSNERDFALAIMKRLGIKGKQIGRTNVFEVSGSDRIKIDKLKPNDELGKVIIFGVEDNEYSTDLEVKTYLMPKRLTVRFTDEAEMFESTEENLPEWSANAARKMNESAEVNPVTGRPLYKMSVPDHMI